MNIVQEILCSHKKIYDLARKNILWQCYGLLRSSPSVPGRSFMFSQEFLCAYKKFFVLARDFLFSWEIFCSREKFLVLVRNFMFSQEILHSRAIFLVLVRNFLFSQEFYILARNEPSRPSYNYIQKIDIWTRLIRENINIMLILMTHKRWSCLFL